MLQHRCTLKIASQVRELDMGPEKAALWHSEQINSCPWLWGIMGDINGPAAWLVGTEFLRDEISKTHWSDSTSLWTY